MSGEGIRLSSQKQYSTVKTNSGGNIGEDKIVSHSKKSSSESFQTGKGKQR